MSLGNTKRFSSSWYFNKDWQKVSEGKQILMSLIWTNPTASFEITGMFSMTTDGTECKKGACHKHGPLKQL